MLTTRPALIIIVMLTLAGCAPDELASLEQASHFDGRLLTARDLTSDPRVIQVIEIKELVIRVRVAEKTLELSLGDLTLEATDVLDAAPARLWLTDPAPGVEVSASYQDHATGAIGRFVDADGGAYLELPPPGCEPATLVVVARAGALSAENLTLELRAARCD